MTAIYDPEDFLALIKPGDDFWTIVSHNSEPIVVYKYTYVGPDDLLNGVPHHPDQPNLIIQATYGTNSKLYSMSLELICGKHQGVFTSETEANAVFKRRQDEFGLDPRWQAQAEELERNSATVTCMNPSLADGMQAGEVWYC